MPQSADASLRRQADFLQANPGVRVTVRAYCSDDEGAREGPQVLAQLRANQIRNALKAAGIAGDRIRIENACRPGGQKSAAADNAAQAEAPSGVDPELISAKLSRRSSPITGRAAAQFLV